MADHLQKVEANQVEVLAMEEINLMRYTEMNRSYRNTERKRYKLRRLMWRRVEFF